MSSKAYKDENSIERGRRLRYVRAITGMTMERFGRTCGVSRTTIHGWEKGINTLTESGAEKVTRAMQEEGIWCTTLWLLQGIGEKAKIVNQDKLSKLHYPSPAHTASPSLGEVPLVYKKTGLNDEIDLFKKRYPNHLIHCIQENAMWPAYRKEDWVAGPKLSIQTLEFAHDTDCIVTLTDHSVFVRRTHIQGLLSAPKLSFYGINADLSIIHPPLLHIPFHNIKDLAPVLRVWRNPFKTNTDLEHS